MNIVACYKIVPDAQDIEVGADGALRLDRAQWVLGEYDLAAIEAAAQLAAATDGGAVLLSAGGEKLNDTKLVKAALSRGADELYRVVDPALEDADAFQTASVLAAALRKIDFDLVVCGEGSADRYSQQVGLLVGALLGLPVVNATGSVRAEGAFGGARAGERGGGARDRAASRGVHDLRCRASAYPAAQGHPRRGQEARDHVEPRRGGRHSRKPG